MSSLLILSGCSQSVELSELQKPSWLSITTTVIETTPESRSITQSTEVQQPYKDQDGSRDAPCC